MDETKFISADDLYYKGLKQPKMLIEGLLSTGLAVLSGDSKIGKSWMVLWFCLKIAKGEPIWGIPTEKKDVIYYALEDTQARIQRQLHMLTDDPPENLMITVESEKLGFNLQEELAEMIEKNPNIGVIFIDTLQKIRDNVSGKVNAYAKDYSDLGMLKEIADLYGVCIFLVHHNRKEKDSSNVFNDMTGSTAIAGAADTLMVLRKEDHCDRRAILSVTGRDVEEKSLKLEMKNNVWELIEEIDLTREKRKEIPAVIYHMTKYFIDHESFGGTMTQFLDKMDYHQVPANVASRYLAEYFSEVFEPLGFEYIPRRNADERIFVLFRMKDWNDDNDGNDDCTESEKRSPKSQHSSSYEAKFMAFWAGCEVLPLPPLLCDAALLSTNSTASAITSVV